MTGSQMRDSLLDEGLTLMLAGMGTVFAFLTILVIAMSLMSSIARRLPNASTDPTDDEIAAMSAAIKKHRHR